MSPAMTALASSPTAPARPKGRWVEAVAGRLLGRPIYAVAVLTLKATFRYRLIQVMFLLLAIAVIALPAIIKHDGTAQGFTQILLTYTLGAVTILLGFSTLWLGCGTLSREVEECQIQMVAVKPIARWQIWLGKWLGLMALNIFLLGISGAAVYFLIYWRATRLPPEVQQELRQEIFVARGSARPEVPQAQIDGEVARQLQERLKDPSLAALDRQYLRTQVVEHVKAAYQVVPPGGVRTWQVPLGFRADSLRNQPLSIRTKFFSANASFSGTFGGWWEIGPSETRRHRPEPMSLAPETFHEFAIPPGYLDDQGILTIRFYNFNDTALLFRLEDGLEVLYPEAGFAVNFGRGLAIILCWLGLLAGIGLAAGSVLSFPVAAFCTVAVLLIASSTGTLKQIIDEGGVSGVNPNTGAVETPSLIDRIAIPVSQALLGTINIARDFSPIDSLSTGRSVSWTQVARAVAQIILVMGGIFAALGITLFTRRELASAQVTT
jgi:ABC-type transport system involved in multi-copper enzyme maturation permease subunit